MLLPIILRNVSIKAHLFPLKQQYSREKEEKKKEKKNCRKLPWKLAKYNRQYIFKGNNMHSITHEWYLLTVRYKLYIVVAYGWHRTNHRWTLLITICRQMVEQHAPITTETGSSPFFFFFFSSVFSSELNPLRKKIGVWSRVVGRGSVAYFIRLARFETDKWTMMMRSWKQFRLKRRVRPFKNKQIPRESADFSAEREADY